MKTLITMLAVRFILLTQTILAEDEAESRFKVQAWDFSDLSQVVAKGVPCAEFLAYLMGPGEKYKLLNTSGVVGPPGIIYTLQNHRGDIGILKCGTAGGHGDGCGHDE
mgnify:FL=1